MFPGFAEVDLSYPFVGQTDYFSDFSIRLSLFPECENPMNSFFSRFSQLMFLAAHASTVRKLVGQVSLSGIPT